jgi:AcrR family transcriptional regulator
VAATAHLPADYDDIRIEDIAAASGIPRATLYYYFSGKDDILAFFLLGRIEEFGRTEAASPIDHKSPRDRLRHLVERQLEHIGSNPAAAQFAMLNMGRVAKAAELTDAADRAFIDPIRSTLRDGIARGDLRDLDVETMAVAIFGAVSTLAIRIPIVGDDIEPARLADDLVEFFWAGMLEPPRKGKDQRS